MGFREQMAAANAKRRQDMEAARQKMAAAKTGMQEDMAAARAEFDAGMAEAREAGEPEPFFMPKGIVAELAGVKLYRDRIEHKGERRPLTGVSARLVEEPILKVIPGTSGVGNVYLMVTGPDFEWSVWVGVTPAASPLRVRLFARRVNKTAPPS